MTTRSLGLTIGLLTIAVGVAAGGIRVAAQDEGPGGAAQGQGQNRLIDPRNPPREDPNWVPPRTPFGHVDIQGQWGQRSGIITYSIQNAEQDRAEHVRIGGQGTVRGRPIIDPIDGNVPYLPWAAKFAAFLFDQHLQPEKPAYLDPVSRGFMEGVPRINYQGGLQIVQYPDQILFRYNYGHHYRVIPLDNRPHVGKDIKLWMGDSRGRWEGNTLLVDVTNNNDQSWFDIVGTFHSDALHMVERWTPTAPDHIVYIVTIEDPQVYSQPWKLRIDFGRVPEDEIWESAVWEGNMLGGLSPEFWGNGLKTEAK